jgi:hypothetical protein
MKFKIYITNIIAALTLVVLVSGFQIQFSESDDASIEGIVGIETAYAGPCGAAGCVGKTGYCGKEVTVIKILDWELDKECHGEDKSDGTEPIQ